MGDERGSIGPAAHRFAKGPMPLVPAMKEEGRPVVGEEAIQSLLREWQISLV